MKAEGLCVGTLVRTFKGIGVQPIPIGHSWEWDSKSRFESNGGRLTGNVSHTSLEKMTSKEMRNNRLMVCSLTESRGLYSADFAEILFNGRVLIVCLDAVKDKFINVYTYSESTMAPKSKNVYTWVSPTEWKIDNEPVDLFSDSALEFVQKSLDEMKEIDPEHGLKTIEKVSILMRLAKTFPGLVDFIKATDDARGLFHIYDKMGDHLKKLGELQTTMKSPEKMKHRVAHRRPVDWPAETDE
jgi:hypothetical protein